MICMKYDYYCTCGGLNNTITLSETTVNVSANLDCTLRKKSQVILIFNAIHSQSQTLCGHFYIEVNRRN
uniref:Uncharacterized protein n=1 Tax=Arundo donax TaxID=35708 RepID=A0A0A8YP84_ARUDO